jgi:hypothetical protein
MIEELQFPQELIAVEKELKTLPHLQHYPHTLPSRRIDILSFAQGTDEYPLLLIECKGERLTQDAMDQALAYNTYVKASFIAIVNRDQIRLRYRDTEIDHLPNFLELKGLV